MFSSENVNGGFSAIGSDELENVNGGVDPVTVITGVLAIGYTVYLLMTHPSVDRK